MQIQSVLTYKTSKPTHHILRKAALTHTHTHTHTHKTSLGRVQPPNGTAPLGSVHSPVGFPHWGMLLDEALHATKHWTLGKASQVPSHCTQHSTAHMIPSHCKAQLVLREIFQIEFTAAPKCEFEGNPCWRQIMTQSDAKSQFSLKFNRT